MPAMVCCENVRSTIRSTSARGCAYIAQRFASVDPFVRLVDEHRVRQAHDSGLKRQPRSQRGFSKNMTSVCQRALDENPRAAIS